MNVPTSKRPPFVGIGWAAAPQGYKFLRHPPNSVFAGDPQQYQDDWLLLLSVFNQVRNGQFDTLHFLPPLIRHSADFHIRSASLKILGDASPQSTMVAIVEFFTHPDPDTRFAAYSAASNTASLKLARSLVKESSHIKPGMELDLLADAVSEILEREPDQLVEPSDPKEFQSTALARIAEIGSRVEKGSPVMFGEVLDLRSIISRIRHFVILPNAEDYNDLVTEIILKFEAMTGILQKEWFDEDENIDSANVLAALDEFESNHQTNRFVTGIRYFFGHPIPVDIVR